MENEPKGGNVILGVIAMGACCGLPLLIVGGAFSGVGAWLADGGWAAVAAAVVVGTGAVIVWRQLQRPSKSDAPELAGSPQLGEGKPDKSRVFSTDATRR